MTVEEAMKAWKQAIVRIDPETPENWWMSPSGSNCWCTVGDMKRLLISHDTLAAEVDRLEKQNRQLRSDIETAVEEEQSRWCERLDCLHTEYAGDCSGCDSGDPLDCVDPWDKVEELEAEVQELRDGLERKMTAKANIHKICEDAGIPPAYYVERVKNMGAVVERLRAELRIKESLAEHYRESGKELNRLRVSAESKIEQLQNDVEMEKSIAVSIEFEVTRLRDELKTSIEILARVKK